MDKEKGGNNNGIYQASHKRNLSERAIEKVRESIQSLQNHLGTGDRTDQIYPVARRKRQDSLALEWAKNNNLLIIAESQFMKHWNASGNIRGGENRVYFEQDDDGSLWAVKMNELTYHEDDLAAFADRLVKSSEYFPDTTLEIIGMVETKRGIKPLLRQPFVVTKAGDLAYRVKIWQSLEERGFRLLDPDNEVWLSPDNGYYFSDPGSNNVLVDEEGNLAFIDVLFRKVTPEKLKEDYPKLDFTPPDFEVKQSSCINSPET